MGRVYYNNGLHYRLFYRYESLDELKNYINNICDIELLNEIDSYVTPLHVLIDTITVSSNMKVQITDDTVEIIKLLLMKGASPLIKSEYIYGRNMNGLQLIEYFIEVCQQNTNEYNNQSLKKLYEIINYMKFVSSNL